MVNKLYDKYLKTFLKKNKLIIFLIILTIIFTIKLPYTIDTPGGYINATKRISLDGAYDSEGSFNMAYVSEIDATIPTLLVAFLNPSWDISKNEDILLENETIDDLLFRNKLALKEANNNAIMVAYKESGHEYNVKKQDFYVVYLDKDSKSNLRVGDKIVEVDQKKITSKEEISKIISEKSIEDEIEFKVINDNKEYKRTATVSNINDSKAIGIVVYEILELETDPKITIKTNNSESGPSGGLMTSLAIYNALTSEDITNGHIIVGTGTIDSDGNVGSIGGVKYKLAGAIKNKAKIFIVPNGENYKEAIELKEKNNYDIEIVGVSTFKEAVDYLKNYD